MDPEWTLLYVLCRLSTRDRYIPATNSDVDPPPTTPPHLDPPSPFPRLTFPFLLFLTITLQYTGGHRKACPVLGGPTVPWSVAVVAALLTRPSCGPFE